MDVIRLIHEGKRKVKMGIIIWGAGEPVLRPRLVLIQPPCLFAINFPSPLILHCFIDRGHGGGGRGKGRLLKTSRSPEPGYLSGHRG